ncbi:MAG: trypsin-like serine protease [Actinomycetota bacterium]
MKRSALAVLLALLASFAFLPTARAQVPIHPGDRMSSTVGGCTLGFVYDGLGGAAGSGVYFGTAAHCVDHVNEDIKLGNGTVFGDVARIGDAGPTATDWAFIKVRADFVNDVRAAVRGHPTYPTGFTKPADTKQLDLIQISGYGMVYELLALTRESRVGLMGADDTHTYDLIGLDTFGDSGGPLVHVPTGKAMGIVSRGCIPICLGPLGTSLGPTVQGILAKAKADSFPVKLRTV